MKKERYSRTSLFDQLVKGKKEARKTRFHDMMGNRVPVSGTVYLPHAFVTTLMRRFAGYRPMRPWFSYRAQTYLSDHVLSQESTVLEFGSGMSSIWLSNRAHKVISIEHNPAWYERVREMLSTHKISNVELYLKTVQDYTDLTELDVESFDFVLIDGIRRADCAVTAVKIIKPGGFIYLDDADAERPDYRQAGQILKSASKANGMEPRYFIDFAPTNMVVTQGMLVQLYDRNEVDCSDLGARPTDSQLAAS